MKKSEEYCSDIQYAVSIKEDTAYLCLNFTRNYEEQSPIRRIQKTYIRRIQAVLVNVKDTSLYQFQLDNKKFKIGTKLFCEIFSISPRVPNKEFVALPPRNALVTFLKSLGYKGSLEFGLFNEKNVDYAELLWEDFQYQINYRKTSARRRKSMPYPRFTKAIIHHFLSKHKSISKRHGVFMNSIEDDAVLGRLKFVSKGEDNQVYGTLIPYVMLNDDIKNPKAYQTYLAISTGIVAPKKARKAMKTTAVNRKISTRVVIRDSPNVSKKKTLDETPKVKGIELLSDAAQLALDTQKAIKASKSDIKTQQQSGGSSEGASITPEVPNEPKGKSAVLSEGASITQEVPVETKGKTAAQADHDDWGSKTESEKADVEDKVVDDKDINEEEIHDDEEMQDDDKSKDIEETDDEQSKSDNDDQEMPDAANTDAKKAIEDKANKEQKGNEQAMDEQAKDY
ncbi:hypothetical protein Tco_1533705 [Tanacetum coccineum]